MHIVFLLLFLLCYNVTIAQNHIPVFSDLEGEELLDNLINSFKPASVLDYSDARDTMYAYVDNINDSVRCVYSGHSLFLPSNVDPSSFLYMNDSPNGINAEHTYPRSKGAADGNALSDIHHLFPTRTPVNAARGSFEFGEIEDSQTTSWFYLNQTQSNPPLQNIDAYSERIDGRFEPREDHKGNVARAMFYFFTMYESQALATDSNFFENQREVLCEWHHLDPVDQAEWERTYRAAEFQNDLPNPFILDCSLAYRSYCQHSQCIIPTSTAQQEATNISIYPNPVVELLNIDLDGKLNVQVFDAIGGLIYENDFLNSAVIDFTSFTHGIYFVRVNAEVYKIIR